MDYQNILNLSGWEIFGIKDQTNGKETYGGGRNLEIDLKSPSQTKITLDFNRTFSPYCARSKHYQCVLSSEPPLPIAITAGELKAH